MSLSPRIFSSARTINISFVLLLLVPPLEEEGVVGVATGVVLLLVVVGVPLVANVGILYGDYSLLSVSLLDLAQGPRPAVPAGCYHCENLQPSQSNRGPFHKTFSL